MNYTCVFYEDPIATGDVHTWIAKKLDNILKLDCSRIQSSEFPSRPKSWSIKLERNGEYETVLIYPFESLLDNLLLVGTKAYLKNGGKLVLFGAVPDHAEIKKALSYLIV